MSWLYPVLLVAPSRVRCAGFSVMFLPTRTTASTHKRTLRPLTPEELRFGCRLGLDSHADVHCIGRHARILEVFHGRSCNVQPFNDSYSPMTNVATANACFAFDTTEGQTYILEVNQALDFTDSMEHSLLCSNQARSHGVIVDDVPQFLDYFSRSTHSIQFPAEDVSLHLDMHGPVSYLPVRYPTDEELEECTHPELSCGNTPWDPMSLTGLFHQASAVMMMESSLVQTSSVSLDLSDLHDNLYAALCANININAVKHSSGKDLSPESLSRLWNISLDAAKRTIRATKQESLRVLGGKISRRVKTRAHQVSGESTCQVWPRTFWLGARRQIRSYRTRSVWSQKRWPLMAPSLFYMHTR